MDPSERCTVRELSPRFLRRLSGQRLVDQVVGLGAGVLVAVVLAAVLLVFGTSTSNALERVYEPSSSAAD